MPGAIQTKDPDEYRARAVLMLARRLHGGSHKAIAQEFNVSQDTVRRSLDFAKRAGLVVQFEDQILQELVPGAIKAMKDAMENGDTAAALEVLKGTGLLLKPSEKASKAGPSVEDETLEIYIREIRGEGDIRGLAPAREGSIIDGRVLEITAGDSPTAPSEVESAGGEGGSKEPAGTVDLSDESAGLQLQPSAER